MDGGILFRVETQAFGKRDEQSNVCVGGFVRSRRRSWDEKAPSVSSSPSRTISASLTLVAVVTYSVGDAAQT